MVVELGAVPYSLLHQVYRECDIYVTPAYAESFAHPLVEAMASGLPIVASDLAVHREICQDAAIYFPALFSGRPGGAGLPGRRQQRLGKTTFGARTGTLARLLLEEAC